MSQPLECQGNLPCFRLGSALGKCLYLHSCVLSHFSHVWLFATQWTTTCQTSLSMGFSRQEYWSGLPFLCPGDLPNPGIEPRSLTLQVDSLPAEPQGKPKSTEVNSLSLLQWSFPTQGSKQGHLHCRRIFYQLSYEGSPKSPHYLISE